MRWRMRVVLPAPSGPIRPWMRPGAKSRLAPSRAWLALSFFSRFSTRMEITIQLPIRSPLSRGRGAGGEGLFRQLDFDGKAWGEAAVGVVEGDLDPEDQAVALLPCLHVL